MERRADLERYIEEITGGLPSLEDAPPSELEPLPLFLRAGYELLVLRLFGRRIFLAAPAQPGDATPQEYARDLDLLRDRLGPEVALVLRDVASHVRNRLVRSGVPFIVPRRQMFLPFLAVDLRERGVRRVRPHRKTLSAASQAVLLHHLTLRSVAGQSLRDLASGLGYSAMTLSNVAEELQALGIAESVTAGRSRHLTFSQTGRALWDTALPYLDSPVRTRRWVRGGQRQAPGLPLAGMTALERYAGIVDDPLPTFAARDRDVRVMLERGNLTGCEGRDGAEALIECWSYDPARLADGEYVDRLSLYLSLKDSPDERVQKELRSLLEGVTW